MNKQILNGGSARLYTRYADQGKPLAAVVPHRRYAVSALEALVTVRPSYGRLVHARSLLIEFACLKPEDPILELMHLGYEMVRGKIWSRKAIQEY